MLQNLSVNTSPLVIWLIISGVAGVALMNIIDKIKNKMVSTHNPNSRIGEKAFNIFRSSFNFGSLKNIQNINIGTRERKIESELEDWLNKLSERLIKENYQEFSILCNQNDTEAFKFAMRLKEFFIKRGFIYNSFIHCDGIDGGNGLPIIETKEDSKSFDVIVSANVDLDKPISTKGGVMINKGKI